MPLKQKKQKNLVPLRSTICLYLLKLTLGRLLAHVASHANCAPYAWCCPTQSLHNHLPRAALVNPGLISYGSTFMQVIFQRYIVHCIGPKRRDAGKNNVTTTAWYRRTAGQ
jgi:hypothetical protein